MDFMSLSKRITFVTIIFFVAFLSLNFIAKAQSGLPPGTYKNSCRSIQIGFGILSAQCQKADGSWKATQLLYKDCDGDIRNDNGVLVCKHKPKPENPLPNGSYKQSCKDAYVDGKRLYAKCRRANGSWNNSSIKYAGCNKDISNVNGVLTCGGGGSNLPNGSYKQTCKNIYVDGNILEAECLNRNGKYSHTSIKYTKCNKGVWNNQGRLECN